MPVSPVAVRLLSSLRRTKSQSSLFSIPPAYFAEGEERNAFVWLREYVQQYKAWPTPQTFQKETGITSLQVQEPLDYYRDEARQRALWQSLLGPFGDVRRAIESKKPDEAIDVMRQCIAAAGELNTGRSGLITLAEGLELVKEDYDAAKRTIGLRGIPTGWPFIDEQTDGWQPGDLITLLGRPGRGKTEWLLSTAHAAHSAGYSVLFLSMEMTVLQLARREFGIESGIDPRFLRSGKLSTRAEVEMRRQLEAMQEHEIPWWWLAGNFKKTVPALKAAVYETEADLIIADASYLLSPENRKKASRREIIADVVEELTALAKETNRPLIQSIQFNRQAIKPKKADEDEASQRNPISHLALEKAGETDVVGQASSIVIGIELGDPPNENTERYGGFLKGREGDQGWWKYNFKHRPVNMSQISDWRSVRDASNNAPPPDLAFMDAAV